MARLSKEAREQAIELLQVGQTQRQVKGDFGCSVKTINHGNVLTRLGQHPIVPDLVDHVLPS